MKIKAYITTYSWSVGENGDVHIQNYPWGYAADPELGEKRYVVEIEVPDRVETLEPVSELMEDGQ